ncbi:hypothetical protein SESBI_20226 [Sesbania bispinosa]|nr:hypothetical protein SESBI_20226 [Sesbania bispinosa]
MPKQDPSGGGAHYGISCLLTKKPAKKDRHSKIYTSQGLRDRRVRLSIEIARKFFDLQDIETPRDDFNVIEESIVIKRKLKPSLMSSSSSHHHHHQNIAIPKEASFNNDFHSFPNMSPNWDASNGAATARSNFCAIASMNLSTGLQIFGKSWEECTNPRLH